MAGSYVLPQVKVFQDFSELPQDIIQDLNPFIFGPHYDLFRYSDEDERADCAVYDYPIVPTADGIKNDVATWTSKAEKDSEVDVDYTKVTFTDVYAALGDPLSGTALDAESNLATTFEFTLGSAEDVQYSLSDLPGTKLHFCRAVRPGDYVMYTADGSTFFSKIRSVDFGTVNTPAPSSKVTSTTAPSTEINKIEVGTTGYYGVAGGVLTVKVTDTKFTLSSAITSIQSNSKGWQLGATANVGRGLTIKVPAGTAAGDYVVTITVDTKSSGHDTVTLADAIPVSSANSLTICAHVDEVEIPRMPTKTWYAVSDGVRFLDNIAIDISGTKCGVKKAKAYITQRNLRTDAADTIHTIENISDIAAKLGKVHPDNPLAYGVYMAKLNSTSVPIKYMGLSYADGRGWDNVLARATNTTDVYAFCPLTDDPEIIAKVCAHVSEMSTETSKAWRIAFISSAPGLYRDMTPAHPTADGHSYLRLVYTAATDSADERLVATCYDDAAGTKRSTVSRFAESGVSRDDRVYVVSGTDDYGKIKYDVYRVIEVLDNAKLVLDPVLVDSEINASTLTYTSSSIGTPMDFQIRHQYTADEYAEAMADHSAFFYDRRTYNVWPGECTSGDVKLNGPLVAAAIAGLACSVQPQQPITNVEIRGIDDIPLTYMTYSMSNLNTIAAGGTLIVMQDKPGSTVYVRHQLSTRYRAGNLNTTELSLCKNTDSISYFFANRFAPYIGRYNITPDLIAEIENILDGGIVYLATMTETNRLIGPQVIGDGSEVVSVGQDPVFKDTAYANVTLNLPKPFNTFNLHLQVV